jgi:hypothetical protein
MKIALDYDDTYTADTELFTLFVFAAIERGHSVTFVTYRHSSGNNDDVELDAKKLGIDVVFTGGRQKAHMFEADIWIDDNPVTVPRFSELDSMRNGCIVNKDF